MPSGVASWGKGIPPHLLCHGARGAPSCAQMALKQLLTKKHFLTWKGLEGLLSWSRKLQKSPWMQNTCLRVKKVEVKNIKMVVMRKLILTEGGQKIIPKYLLRNLYFNSVC